MTHKFLRGQFTPNVTRPVASRHAALSADASELGLAPGEWPEEFDVVLGSGRLMRFERVGALKQYGDFIGVSYTAISPLTLTPISACIFND